MKAYRPTSLKMASRHCPRVLDHLETGDPYDRAVYETGIAAHAVLQLVGEETERLDRELEPAEIERLAGAVGQALIEKGRTFDGKPEPPLSADAVWQGRDLALRWLRAHPLASGSRYEVGLAVDAQWRPVPYDSPLARFRAILDVLAFANEGDEESAWRILRTRDYKSAWSTDEGELETLQLRGQAVLAWIHFGESVDVIRREVVNLRTMKVYGGDFESELHLADDGALEKLRRWRDDLQATMESYDRMVEACGGRRPASPGAGCHGCPFLLRCSDALDLLTGEQVPVEPAAVARAYAVADALGGVLKERLQAITAEAPIDLGDALVGTIPLEQREAAPDAYAEVWEAWRGEKEPTDELARGLLKALDPGVTAIEKVAKALYPARGEKPLRDDLVAACSTVGVKRRFGIHRKAKEAAA